MIRQATPADSQDIEAFLSRHAGTSMFLRANLARHGTEERTHPTGTRFWLWQDGPRIAAVFGLSNGGYVTCQVPDPGPESCAAFARAIRGEKVCGITGVPDQTTAIRAATGLDRAATVHDQIEPLCLCDLSDLPPGDAVLRKPAEEDRALLEEWWTAYQVETGMSSPAEARAAAADRTDISIRESRVWLMIENGTPVAMAGLSAELPDMVQVGGVWVPPALRNRGLGRQVTAARLRAARETGVRRAILFANNAAALRAYEAIGFRRIGHFQIALFEPHAFVTGPQVAP